MRAPVAGRLVYLLDPLAPEMWIDGKASLERVVMPEHGANLPEDALWRLRAAGVTGRFAPATAMGASWRVRLDESGSSAVSALDRPAAALAQVNSGPIATQPTTAHGALLPMRALVAAHLVAEARDGAGFTQPVAGTIILAARGERAAATSPGPSRASLFGNVGDVRPVAFGLGDH